MAMTDQPQDQGGILSRWLEGIDERDRPQAIGMGLINLGGGLLSQSGPGGSIGQGFAQGAQSAMAVPDQMRQQAMQRAMIQQKMAQQKAMQSAMASMPEDQRAIAMMNPEGFAKARAEQLFKTQEPMKVGYGEQVIDPTSGRVIATGTEDPSKRFLTVGNVVYDRTNMKPVYSAPQQGPGPTELQRNLDAMGLQRGTPEYAQAMRQGMGGGFTPKLDAGTVWDPAQGKAVPLPGTAAEREAKDLELQKSDLEANLDRTIRTGKELQTHPGRGAGTGASSFLGYIPGTDAAGFSAKLEAFKSQNFIPAVSQMKGMGQLSDAEGKRLMAAIGALDPSMPEKEFNASLGQIVNDLEAAKARRYGGTKSPAKSASPYSDKYGLE